MTTNNFYVKGNFLEPGTPDGKHRFKTIPPGKYSYEFLESNSPDWKPYPIARGLPPVLVSPKAEVAICFKQDRDGKDIWTVLDQQDTKGTRFDKSREYRNWEKGYLLVWLRVNPEADDVSYGATIHDLVGKIYVPRTTLQVTDDPVTGRIVDKPWHNYDHLDSNKWNNYYLNLERVTATENKDRREHPERKYSAIKRHMDVYQSDEWPAGYNTLDERNMLIELSQVGTHIDSDIVYDQEAGCHLPYINPYKSIG